MKTDNRPVYSIIDLETTGLDFSAEIVEIGLVQLNANLEVCYTWDALVLPENLFKLTGDTITIHGIVPSMLFDKQFPATDWKTIWNALTQQVHNTILCGHNVNFDIRIMAQNYRYHPQNVPEFMNKFSPGRPVDTKAFFSKSLQKLAEEFKEEWPVPDAHLGFMPHTALFDCWCVATLMRQIKDKLKNLRDSFEPCFLVERKMSTLKTRMLALPIHQGEVVAAVQEEEPQDVLAEELSQLEAPEFPDPLETEEAEADIKRWSYYEEASKEI